MTLPNIVARLLQKKTKKSKRFKSRQLREKRDQRPWPHMYVCSEKQVVRSSTYLNDC